MTEFVLAVLAMGSGVFAASAIAKLRGQAAYRDYRAGLRATMVVPERLLRGTAASLAVIEAVAAAGLAGAAVLIAAGTAGAFPLTETALAVAVAVAALLSAGVAVVIRRGTRARCACFGGRSARPIGTAHLIRNACLLVLLAAGLTGARFDHARPALAGSALAVVAGMVVALIFIRADDLAELFAPAQPDPPPLPMTPGRQARPDRSTG